MKKLLLVFVVLLFLLTLLSSFGGSIRPAEPFYDTTPAVLPEHFELPRTPSYNTFAVGDGAREYFYEDTQPIVIQPPNPPPSAPTPPPPVVPKKEEPKILYSPSVEKFVDIEKFEIPEPFVNPDSEVGAPF